MTNLLLERAVSFATVLPAASGPWLGRTLFAGVFVLVLIWLLLMPGRLIGQQPGSPAPWWRNVRFWAALVALVQIWVYLRWG